MSPWFKLALAALGVFAFAFTVCAIFWLFGRVSGLVDGRELAMQQVRDEMHAKCAPWASTKPRKLTGVISCQPLSFMGNTK